MPNRLTDRARRSARRSRRSSPGVTPLRDLDGAIAWYQARFLDEVTSWRTAPAMLDLLAAVKGRRRFQGFGKYYERKVDKAGAESLINDAPVKILEPANPIFKQQYVDIRLLRPLQGAPHPFRLDLIRRLPKPCGIGQVDGTSTKIQPDLHHVTGGSSPGRDDGCLLTR